MTVRTTATGEFPEGYAIEAEWVALHMDRLGVDVAFVPDSNGDQYGPTEGFEPARAGTYVVPEWAATLHWGISGRDVREVAIRAFLGADDEWRRSALAVLSLGGNAPFELYIIKRLLETGDPEEAERLRAWIACRGM